MVRLFYFQNAKKNIKLLTLESFQIYSSISRSKVSVCLRHSAFAFICFSFWLIFIIRNLTFFLSLRGRDGYRPDENLRKKNATARKCLVFNVAFIFQWWRVTGRKTEKLKSLWGGWKRNIREKQIFFIVKIWKVFHWKFLQKRIEKGVKTLFIIFFYGFLKFLLFSLEFSVKFSNFFTFFSISLKVCSRYGLRRFVAQICSKSSNTLIHRLLQNHRINFCSWIVH